MSLGYGVAHAKASELRLGQGDVDQIGLVHPGDRGTLIEEQVAFVLS